MKTKNFISLLVISTSLSVFSVNAQVKIAHISMDSIIKSMPEYDSARRQEKSHYEQLEAQMEAMQKEYQQKGQKYQQDSKTMTELLRQTAEKELQDLGQRIQSFQQEAQGDLQHFGDSLNRPVIEKARNAVKNVAKAKGYNYVLDTSAGIVVYFEQSDDIFGLVAENLGIKGKAKH
jgi:outer membrane protein